MNKRIIALAADQYACGIERMYKPFSLFNETYPDAKVKIVDPGVSLAYAEFSNYDYIIIQRPKFAKQLDFIKRIKTTPYLKHVKLVVEYDDDLFHVDQFNISYKYYKHGSQDLKNIKEILRLADGVIVSTPELATEYRKYTNKPVTHAINFVNPKERFYTEEGLHLRKQLPEDKVVLMWSGSTSHLSSILFFQGTMQTVLMQNPNAVFAFCGNREYLDILKTPEKQTIFIQPTKPADFNNVPSAADICLAPMPLTPFNNCKSELRMLQYGIFGIPSIASPVEPYKRFAEVAPGSTLLPKKNRIDQWVKHCNSLIRDKELRLKSGQLAQEAVLKHYTAEISNKQRADFLLSL